MSAKEGEQGLREAVRALVGLECWGCVAGTGTGSMFTLELGEKFPRDRPVQNPHLAAVVREHEAEFCLFVKDTPWRVQSVTEVVATWLDANAKDGPMVAALDRLAGARVVAAELDEPARDLKLSFDNGLTLVVFPDGSPSESENDDDYTLFTRHWSFSVRDGGRVEVEKHLLDVDLTE
jgi:hypothetical protein